MDSTFRELMFSRIGNRDKSASEEIGPEYALLPSMIHTNYAQGAPEETGQPLDFAINGDGFFQIQGENARYFTRNGSFIVDNGDI